MPTSAQITVGPKLISNSREAWLGYYVFTALTLLVLGGGAYWLRVAGLEPGHYGLAVLLVLTLAAVCAGIAITCHILGHIIDELDALRDALHLAGSTDPG